MLRYVLLIALLGVSSCLFAADEASDEAEYVAYQDKQQAIRVAVAKLDALQADKARLRNIVDDVKDRHRGLNPEQAMRAWRVAVRSISDKDARMSAYVALRGADAFISELKARYATSTIAATQSALNDAISAAQAELAAERAK